MKYLIPSLGRSEIIKEAVALLGKDDVLVYVQVQDYDKYVDVLGGKSVRKLPKGTFGIGATRKIMLDENRDEDFVFMLDDDITAFEYKFSERVELIVDPNHIKDIVYNGYQLAYDLGTPLFGYTSAVGPILYTQLDHMHFSGFVNIGIGIIPELLGNINFDPRFTVMHEDHDFTLQTKYHKRFIVLDNRYSIRQKKAWLTEGGCSTIRNESDMQKCRDLLVQKYGHKVCTKSPKKDKQFVLKTPF